MVSPLDVGACASQFLLDEERGKRIVQFAGAEERTARDVADAFAAVLGRPVDPVLVPPSQRAGILADARVPPEAALLEMYDAIAAGRVTWQLGIESRRGVASLEQAVERMILPSQPVEMMEDVCPQGTDPMRIG